MCLFCIFQRSKINDSEEKTGHSGIDSKLFHNSPTLHQMASYKSLITRLDRTRVELEGWLYRTFRHVREGQFEITIITSSTKTKPVHSSIFTFISFMQTFISVLCTDSVSGRK